jgi:hypothetical protein
VWGVWGRGDCETGRLGDLILANYSPFTIHHPPSSN